MDGFDDLLDASRSNPILDNPFEDPFARPRSPDPWLTFQTPAHDEDEHTPVAEHPHESLSPTQQEHSFHSSGLLKSDSDVVDPLDAKAANEEDETEDPQPLRRQISSMDSSSHPSPVVSLGETAEPATTSAPKFDPTSSREASPPPVSSTKPEKTPTSPPRPHLPTSPTSTISLPLAPEPTPSTQASAQSPQHTSQPDPTPPRSSIASPLEGGPMTGQLSFAPLALGGEIPGWQGPATIQAPFESQHDTNGAGAWGQHSHGEGFVNGVSQREGSEGDDDDDDDIPIAQGVRTASQTSAANPPRKPEIQPTFLITVGDPQKVGDPVRPFITYTVHTTTTSPLYRRSTFSVLRRYSDFLWLYETLSINNPGVIVPPVPEKQQYGRFQDTFVENRRAALNKCIQKIANHPCLRNDPDLKLFLESDSFVLDIKHRKAEIAHERGGLMASVGSSLVGPRFYETDEWFDQKKIYLDSLESQLRGLVKAIDMVSKQRNEVALSMAEFAENIAALAACDMGKQLSHSLTVLADVQRKAKELQDLQAREDVSTIMSTVDEYARLVNSVRLAFASRKRLYASWQNADSDARKTQQAHEKARRQGRLPSDRLGGSLAEIAETERRAMEAKQDFDGASKMIKSELARFEQERVEDFKNALIAFLDGMIIKQKEIIQSWESYQESLLKRMGNPPATSRSSTSG